MPTINNLQNKETERERENPEQRDKNAQLNLIPIFEVEADLKRQINKHTRFKWKIRAYFFCQLFVVSCKPFAINPIFASDNNNKTANSK